MSLATLLYKESRLVVPLPYLGIAALALFNLIPHYPPIIGVSYVLPALLIAFSEANANKDHQFTISLPVPRDRVVLARHLSVVGLETVQITAVALVAVLYTQLHPGGHALGMDANPAFFGAVLAAFGVFNVIFLPGYFTTAHRTGRPGVLGAIMFFVTYGIFELLVLVIPGLAEVLDTLDPAMAGPQLLVLLAGALALVGLTVVSYRLSVRRFDRVNL